jgi:hypothetical protein
MRKGQAYLLNAIIVFILLAVLVMISFNAVLFIVPNLQFILQLVIILGIYRFIRMFLGKGVISYAISGIFIYIFVFKYTWLAYNAWLFYFILSTGLFSMVIWLVPMFLTFVAGALGRPH